MGLWEGAMKVSGWTYRMRAIKAFVFGVIFILLGLVLSVVFKSLYSLVLSLFGIVGIIVGIFYWKRSKSLVQGRLYAKEK